MKLHLRAAAAIALLAVFGAACQPHQFKATVLQPPKQVDDFSLPASDGTTFTLGEHKDQFVILYFGYTNCPDICPATLAQIQQAIQKLGPDASKVKVAFVTVDPERDSLDILKAYLVHFNPDFVGLRPADENQLAALTKQFGVYYEQATPDAGTSGHEVNHTSTVMVINQMGLRAVFGSDVSGADMAADLQEIMKSK